MNPGLGLYYENDEIHTTAAINDTDIYTCYKSKQNTNQRKEKRKEQFSQNILQQK